MATEIIFEVEDRSGTKSTTSVQVGTGFTIATITGFAVAWANAIDNIIHGLIRSATAYFRPLLSGLTSNDILSTADVEHVGKFEFLTAGGNRVKLNLPTLNEVVILAYDSDELDQSEPEVAALITAMTVGIAVTGASIVPCDVAEVDITDCIFAREAFRNSGAHR